MKTVTLPYKVNCLMLHNFTFYFDNMFAKVSIFLKIFIIRKMNTKYFHGFIKINTFHATECHMNSIQNTNTCDFTFSFISFNAEKFEKVFNSFTNSIIDFLSLRKQVVKVFNSFTNSIIDFLSLRKRVVSSV